MKERVGRNRIIVRFQNIINWEYIKKYKYLNKYSQAIMPLSIMIVFRAF